jgi:hypothetical protein
MKREQRTGNREQGTPKEVLGYFFKNCCYEKGTGNREQGTGNREQGTPEEVLGYFFIWKSLNKTYKTIS